MDRSREPSTVGDGGRGSHTPGPWHVEGRRASGYIISYGVNSYGDGPDGYVGVFGPMFAGGSSSLAADARLIAAAPTMLDLARKNLATMEWQARRLIEMGKSAAELTTAIEETRAALAEKAGA